MTKVRNNKRYWVFAADACKNMLIQCDILLNG